MASKLQYNEMSDFISEFDINVRIAGIAGWIKGNRNTDPNAFEMVNLFLFAGKYASEGSRIDKGSLTELWNMRSEDFSKCNIDKNHFVYKIAEITYQSAMEGNSLVNNAESHIALRRMAGVGLFLMQQKRDMGSINYNNYGEMMELLKSASILKETNPDVFESASVGQFTELLVSLQPTEHLNGFQKEEIEFYSSKLKNSSGEDISTNKTIYKKVTQ